MIIETKRRRNTYKEPIILWEYQTNKRRGLIKKNQIYVIERNKSFAIVRQKGKRYFSYKLRSTLKKEETGIVLFDESLDKSYLYLLSNDNNKASELLSEHFKQLKINEKQKLEQAQHRYNHEIAKLESLELMEIKEDNND